MQRTMLQCGEADYAHTDFPARIERERQQPAVATVMSIYERPSPAGDSF
jgi:hypothetical protein